MRKLLLGAMALAAIVAAYPAGAADLPTSTYKAPGAPAAAPTSPWTGFYAGLGLGFRVSRTDATTTSVTVGSVPFGLTSLATSQPFDGTAFRASPYVGLNWQVAPQWVVGVEGDVGFVNQTTTLAGFDSVPGFTSGLSTDSLAVKTTWDASARGRIGFLVTPATLVYATGGAAWQHYDVTSTCVSAFCLGSAFGPSFIPSVITNSTTKAGWTIGGGIETALWGNWFARADYRYADFGTSSFNLTRASTLKIINPTVDNFDVALRTHTATFGLAYKFGDPVVGGNPAGAFPVKALPAVVSWNGLYAGLGLGLRSSRTDATTTSLTAGGVPSVLTGLATSQPFDGAAFRANPYVGLNWQVAPQWVIGVEGDVGFANQATTLAGFTFGPSFSFNDDESADSLAVKTTWDASARGRIGFLVTPATLVYATGGAAWQHYDVTSTCVSADFCGHDGFTPAVVTNSVTKLGWTVGGGIETALWGNWFARADYRYADFGTSAFNITRASTTILNPIVENFNVALRTHTATLGIAYKFDWGARPVVARY